MGITGVAVCLPCFCAPFIGFSLSPKSPQFYAATTFQIHVQTQKWLRVAGDPRNLMPVSPSDGIFYQFRVSRPSGANADSSEP
jgi:hypothetical protein